MTEPTRLTEEQAKALREAIEYCRPSRIARALEAAFFQPLEDAEHDGFTSTHKPGDCMDYADAQREAGIREVIAYLRDDLHYTSTPRQVEAHFFPRQSDAERLREIADAIRPDFLTDSNTIREIAGRMEASSE